MNETYPYTNRAKKLREKLKKAKERAKLMTTFDYDSMFIIDKTTNAKIHVSEVDHYVKLKERRSCKLDHKYTSPVKSESTEELSLNSPTAGGSTEITPIPDVNMLAVYREMETNTIILSIEYCHSCVEHPMTLRHQEDEYLQKAEESLRILAERVYTTYPCVKLGVISVPARVNRKEDGAMCRVGAFEIQVAFAGGDYKKRHNTPYVELLHSKLSTRRWPSRVVLEKRLHSFLSRSAIRYFHHVPGGDSAAARNLSFSWYTCPLADPSWKSKPASNIPGNADGDVTWVFDYRVCLFIDEWVSVIGHRMPFTPPGCCEDRIPCTGRVVGVERDAHSSEWILLVLPRFGSHAIACPTRCCTTIGDVESSRMCGVVRGCDTEMWSLLRPVLGQAISAQIRNEFEWRLLSPDDHASVRPCSPSSMLGGGKHSSGERTHDNSGSENGELIHGSKKEVFLTVSSYYSQIGHLVWEVIRGYDTDIQSLPSGKVSVDYLYSEDAVDWLFRQRQFLTREGLLNVTQLCDYVVAINRTEKERSVAAALGEAQKRTVAEEEQRRSTSLADSNGQVPDRAQTASFPPSDAEDETVPGETPCSNYSGGDEMGSSQVDLTDRAKLADDDNGYDDEYPDDENEYNDDLCDQSDGKSTALPSGRDLNKQGRGGAVRSAASLLVAEVFQRAAENVTLQRKQQEKLDMIKYIATLF